MNTDIQSFWDNLAVRVENAIKEQDGTLVKNVIEEIDKDEDISLYGKIIRCYALLRIVYYRFLMEKLPKSFTDNTYIDDNLARLENLNEYMYSYVDKLVEEYELKMDMIRAAASYIPSSKRRSRFFSEFNKIQYNFDFDKKQK
jgi:hypothetical protein